VLYKLGPKWPCVDVGEHLYPDIIGEGLSTGVVGGLLIYLYVSKVEGKFGLIANINGLIGHAKSLLVFKANRISQDKTFSKRRIF